MAKSQTNKVLKTTGMYLIGAGSICVRLGFKLKPKEYTRRFVENFLSAQLGLNKDTISMADKKYYLIDWDKWGEIIDLDIIDTLIYKSDYFDCDNFAFLFASRATDLYKLNSAGVAFGAIYKASTGEYIGRHAFNVIVTQDNGILHLYCYEPMTDGSALIVKGRDTIIGSWKYVPDWLIFF